MGCLKSKPKNGRDLLAEQENARIEAVSEDDMEKETERIKLLLLGAGESGKSTVMKQMRILYGDKYSDDEIVSYKLIIQQNCVEFMEILCKAVKNYFPKDPIVETEQFQKVALSDDISITYRKFPEWSDEYVAALKYLWRAKIFQTVFEKRADFQIIESTSSFMDRIDDISDEFYKPNQRDILTCRLRTRGIHEERLNIDGQVFCFFDVGGQRNERRKWMKVFDGVHGVVFIVALSEFNQTLWEANNVNRMAEAVNVFEEYVNREEFENSAFILFLNKCDIFREKIKKFNLSELPGFGDYKGKPYDYDDGISYFKEKFMRRNLSRDDLTYHVTCATDTSNVGVVFRACKEVILGRSLQQGGFLN